MSFSAFIHFFSWPQDEQDEQKARTQGEKKENMVFMLAAVFQFVCSIPWHLDVAFIHLIPPVHTFRVFL